MTSSPPRALWDQISKRSHLTVCWNRCKSVAYCMPKNAMEGRRLVRSIPVLYKIVSKAWSSLIGVAFSSLVVQKDLWFQKFPCVSEYINREYWRACALSLLWAPMIHYSESSLSLINNKLSPALPSNIGNVWVQFMYFKNTNHLSFYRWATYNYRNNDISLCPDACE